MTFSCPNQCPDNQQCQLLDTLCVPGRPGCIQEDTATFAEDIESRIKRAEENARNPQGRRRSQ